MKTRTKLAGFAAVVAATFGGALAVGAAVGPIDVGDGASHTVDTPSDSAQAQGPRGLSISESGYRLVLESDTAEADAASTVAFQIVDDTGMPVTRFEELHERPLHFIVIARNLVDYLHLHPDMDATGRWTVQLPSRLPGSYRVFADFQPVGGDNLTLGADIAIPGNVEAPLLPIPSNTSAIDEYIVSLSGTPLVGDAELGFTVELDGEQVKTDAYLGAAGHLVAIRSGDLAYLHVHPHETDTSSVVSFTGEFPTAGTYRLFFDFSHNGEVRTAAFTVIVPEATDDPHDTMTMGSAANTGSAAHDQFGG